MTGEGGRLDLDALAEHVATGQRRWLVPGVELAAVRDGQVVVAQGYGLRDHERELPATAATLFHHGSIAKGFTAALVGTLVDEGLLEWDRPVRDVWPPFRLSDPVATERVTVADLLSHRSGLARHEWAWLANPSWTGADLAARLRHLPMGHDLRTDFEYNNLGYVAVGQVVKAVTGADWHTALRERVLDPLGMHASLTSLEQAEGVADCARPHDVHAGEIVPVPFRVMDGVAPAGLLFSCASDIARWLLLHLGDGALDGRRVLSAETLEQLHRVRVPLGVSAADPEFHYVGYALGWVVGTWGARRILWHSGGVDGFGAELLLLPDEGIGVAVSVNSTHTSSLPAALTRHVAQLLLGEQPEPWSARLHERWTEERALATAAVKTVVGTTPSHPIDDFAGVYDHPGYGALHVEVDAGELRMRLGELVLITSHRHFDTWTAEYPPLAETVSVTFCTDADGNVRDAVLPLDDSTGEVTFRRRPDPDTDDDNARTDAERRTSDMTEPVEDGLQERLEALLADVGAPGAVLAVLRGDDVVEYAAGIANLDTGVAVTADTLFPVASVSKVYTATLVLQLVDDGLLDLDEPLTTYLPGFRVADPVATETLTARHLLTHTGGIGGDKQDSFGRGDDALGRYVEDCASLGQVHDVGATFSYCNSGYIILGHLVSVLRAATWDEVLRERLLLPIGATKSGTLPEDLVWLRLAAGHQSGDDEQPALLHAWEMDRAHGPAGGVLATARDVLRFVQMHLRAGVSADGARVLSAVSAGAMVTPQVAMANPYGGASHWGLGWELYSPDGPLSLIGHDGDLLGHHARMLACPEAGLAVVLLVNGDGADHIAHDLFPRILGEVGAVLPPNVGPPETPPDVDLQAVEGSYQTLAVKVTVTAAGDHLDASLRIIAPDIAAMIPESQRERHVTFVPVSQSLFVMRDDEDDSWTSAVFAESGGQRYLHIGGRAMRATAVDR
jgi:CubicO group peptidase (beta-lactamase class C family)